MSTKATKVSEACRSNQVHRESIYWEDVRVWEFRKEQLQRTWHDKYPDLNLDELKKGKLEIMSWCGVELDKIAQAESDSRLLNGKPCNLNAETWDEVFEEEGWEERHQPCPEERWSQKFPNCKLTYKDFVKEYRSMIKNHM